MSYQIQPLTYATNALEPFIDAKTMEIHHGKHYAGYVANLNNALAEAPEVAKRLQLPDAASEVLNQTSPEAVHAVTAYRYHIMSLQAQLRVVPALGGGPLEFLLANECSAIPEPLRITVRNQAGGVYNHELFWRILSRNGRHEPRGQLAEAINSSFGSFEEFKAKFTKVALARFGSGWAWLVSHDRLRLEITSTPNQDNPLMYNQYPLLGVDLWEHGYYLSYQNRRADYLAAIWSVLDWSVIEARYESVNPNMAPRGPR